MIFDWQNYYTLARELSECPENIDACLRSSVSRAYYSAYGKARVFCMYSLGILSTKEATDRNCHAILVDKLAETDEEDLLVISQKISALKIRRQKADYDAKFDVNKKYVAEALEMSKEIIELISNYP
jgi:uncharacterized protein (UPF0332 family)